MSSLFRLVRHICPSNNVFRGFQLLQKRTILSANYACTESWEQRLNESSLKQVQLSVLTMQLQENLDKQVDVSPVDIDIFANKMNEIDKIQLDFAMYIISKFRQTPQTIKTFESTHHAIIRALFDFNEMEKLLKIISDKFKYGVFLDYYTANMIMDRFIENNQYYEAAQIAYDSMYQEDFANPLTRLLAWHSCDLHMRHTVDGIAKLDAEKEAQRLEQLKADMEEEEEYIPVKYIQNPWYDDHWDLHKDSLLLGKTMLMIATDPSKQRSEDTTLERSYQLIGAMLYEKLEKVIKLLHSWCEQEDCEGVAKEAVDLMQRTLEGIETQEVPEPKEPGLVRLEDCRPYITEEQKTDATEKIQSLLSKLESQNKIVELDLSAQVKDRLMSVLPICEEFDIKQQKRLHQEYNQHRADFIQEQIKDYKLQERKKRIAEELNELQRTEEKLRYFEQEQKIKLGIQRQPKIKNIEEVQEEEVFVEAPGERSKRK